MSLTQNTLIVIRTQIGINQYLSILNTFNTSNAKKKLGIAQIRIVSIQYPIVNISNIGSYILASKHLSGSDG